MERTSTEETAREARLQALREDLDRKLDQLRNEGGSGLGRVSQEFERAWKELNELVGNETLH